MVKKLRIAFDIDDVLADFVGGVRKLIGDTHPELVEKIAQWRSSNHAAIDATGGQSIDAGLNEEERGIVWKHIDAAGHKFWSGLEMLPWAKSWHKKALTYTKEVIFLTSSSDQPESASGKLDWINTNFSRYRRNYLIGPRKEFCATPCTILIDDSDHKIDPFREAGGYGILVPQPWNTNKDFVANRDEYVLEQMDTYAKRILGFIEDGDPKDKRVKFLEDENARLSAIIRSTTEQLDLLNSRVEKRMKELGI